ncbi:MAG: undecaprenyl/decaprenyl-phosphate alpha-N-acetylglucosaminyl 1-phosphate transferase [Bacteroidia bacterium]|nr:undecaprenyl/decaprenyl-phosphate alpha-N-acetylglucosaminyl 1-phosphate transferase [Bacteroidia bacterium]
MNFLENIPLVLTVFFFICFIFSVLINNILLKFAQTLGTRGKQASQIRWNPSIKPSLGGISFFVVFLLSYIFINLIQTLDTAYRIRLTGVLAVCTMAFLMGLADDAFNTQPLLKFLTQITCALVLLFTGTYIRIFENEFFNYLITIIWIVGIMNSINMLDNMDGITTIVSISVCVFFILINISLKQMLHPFSILSIGVLASLTGFLIYNFHPSKMFMGDTGSQFLGVFMGSVAIHFCWNNFPQNLIDTNEYLYHFGIVGLVFLLPLVDTITVVINRIAIGNSPFIGGKDHTTHHLFFKGVTEKRIAILYLLLSLIGVFLAYKLVLTYSNTLFWISISYIILVFLALYINTKIKKSAQ